MRSRLYVFLAHKEIIIKLENKCCTHETPSGYLGGTEKYQFLAKIGFSRSRC